MNRGHFTRIGFILASAGSAVGLGNIWKFPYIAGENGGGAFVLVYLVTVLLIGLPLLISEIMLGNMAQREPVSAFEHLAPNGKKGWRLGGFAFAGGFFILTFYSVVIGWLFYYIYLTLFHLPASAAEAETLFMTMLTADIPTQLLFHTLAMLLVGYIVSRGIKGGIEKANRVMMPVLFGIILVMFFYSLSFSTFGKAFGFMFAPDFSKLTPTAILIAVGHAFFTLSIGMATIMTYASFSGRQTRILNAGLWIVGLDTAIALLAGLMMFTFMFSFGMDAGKGPGLVFISMPAVFYQMGVVGNLFAVLFFIALAFAGLTSAISILEPTVAYLTQRKKIGLKKASWGAAGVVWLIGILALLSNIREFEWLSVGSASLFDTLDFLTSAVMLPLGGLAIAVFIGFVMDKNHTELFLEGHGFGKRLFKGWFYTVKYVVPVGVIVVMLNSLGLF
jgi:NSS family neurotransmitter:Na+ symporter